MNEHRGAPRPAAERRPGPAPAPPPAAPAPAPAAPAPAAPAPGDRPRPTGPADGGTPRPDGGTPRPGARAEEASLLRPADLDEVSRRWHDVQTGFVDEPRQAVQEADALVQELMQQLAQQFAAERSQLESQWSRGDQVSTEELRVVLQRYRTFFQRLLAVR